MAKTPFKIALAQMRMEADPERNLLASIEHMTQARAHGAALACFPELQLSPFFPQYPAGDATRYAMALEDTPLLRLARACRDLGMVGAFNVYLREAGQLYDASPVVDADGRLLGISKMVHVAQAAQFYEQDYYTPSNTGFRVYRTAVGMVGVVVCFDRHFPESVRSCALQGAQLIVIPTANIKSEPLDLFEAELRVAAFQNGVYIAMCNRVGREGEMDFCGQSLAVDPFGKVIAMGSGQEELLLADIDFSAVERAQAQRPYLVLRRPEAYC